MSEKVTINFLKYQRTAEGGLYKDDKGHTKSDFEKCIVLELPSDKVRAIEACVDYPAAVKALVQDLLDEHKCDHAEIAAHLRDKHGRTRFIRTYAVERSTAVDMAKVRAAKNK